MRCKMCKKEELMLEAELDTGVCLYCQNTFHKQPEDEVVEEIDETDYPPTFIGQEYDFMASRKSEFERIIIPGKVWTKMHYYCKIANGEVSGLGTIVKEDDNTLKVTNIIMLKQEGSSASTEISQESLDNFMLKLARKGQSLEDWKLWWHTHHDFGTFWSPTDTGNIETMKKILGRNGYLVSINTNKQGDVIARYDDKRHSNPLHVVIKPYKGYASLRSKCHRQVKKLVKNNSFIGKYTKIIQPYLCGYEYY